MPRSLSLSVFRSPSRSLCRSLSRSGLPRLVRLMISSGIATAADSAVLLVLCWQLGLPPGPAAVCGCLVGGAVNFAIGRSWVFRARDRAWWRQAARYAVIVVGGGAVVSGLAVAALVAAGLPLPVAKAAAVVIVLLAWTYPMSARVVFAAAQPASPASLTGPTGPTAGAGSWRPRPEPDWPAAAAAIGPGARAGE